MRDADVEKATIGGDGELIEALWKTVEGTLTDANINNISTLYRAWQLRATINAGTAEGDEG